MRSFLHARLTALMTLLTALLLGGLLLAPSATAASASDTQVRQSLKTALAQVGDPYEYGAEGPDSFDCSGLVYYAARKAGITGVPRVASDQAAHADRIPRSQMQPGDLLFFDDGDGVYHVGIFTGWKDGQAQMVDAPRPGRDVQVEKPWTDSWFAGTLR